MANFGLSDRLCGMDESDLTNMLEMEMVCEELENQMEQSNFDTAKIDLENYEMCPDWLDFFDDPVLNDKMMSEATTTPVVKSEHSYSIGKQTATGNSLLQVKAEPLTHHITLDEHTGPAINPKFLELDASSSTSEKKQDITVLHQVPRTRSIQTVTVMKQEPRVIVKNEPIVIEARRPTQQQSLLKPSSILLTKQRSDTMTLPRYEMTTQMGDDLDEGIYLNVMPMTPPGSSSDSDGGLSPRQSPTPSPIRQVVFKSTHREINPATAIYSQPIPTSGVLVLTEEEKRTLISEGYPIPSKLPLSKMEEKNLKKVRRKIKNKISAQESRRKRKEYMDHLEKKMEDISKENNDLRKKCDKFELNNQSLISQLNKLQNLVKKLAPQQGTAQTGICLMVMILCFAVFFGDWVPASFSSGYGSHQDSLSISSLGSSSYLTDQMKPSRTLLNYAEEERSCGNEPWPLLLARKSFECITNLIAPSSAAEDDTGSWSNTSDMPFVLAAHHESSINA